ncbi:AAA family ATPase, partial [Proteus mirabilis]
KFEKPKFDQICLLIQNRLSLFDTDDFDWGMVAEAANGLSSAEITRSCEDASKESVLNFNAKITSETLLKAFSRRQSGNNK